MDLLRKELERKKQTLAKVKEVAGTNSGNGKKKRKYLRLADLRQIEEKEQEEKDRKRWMQQRQRDKQKNNLTSSMSSSLRKNSNKNKTCDDAQTNSNKSKEESNSDSKKDSSSSTSASLSLTKDLETSPLSITRKLRQMGLVVRYFGEGNTMRSERLQKALEQQSKTLQGLSELEEFRLGKEHEYNPFLEKDKSNNQNQQLKNTQHLGSEETSADKARNETIKTKNYEIVDNTGVEKEEDQSDTPKVIYKYLKSLLKEWERRLADRPESITRSVAGKNESKTLKQCKDYIRPLFKLLKSRKLEDGLQFHLLKIVNFAKQGEFVQAHDSYMDMAIGRAAWPIGVTMVGIHARSGRAKIESSNVAHVMNSELQRKYLTSVKRLLTFDQKRRTDVDPSKKVT